MAAITLRDRIRYARTRVCFCRIQATWVRVRSQSAPSCKARWDSCETATASRKLCAGGFGEAPARMNHYAWTSAETVVQVHGQGPFQLTYVNPADDPSK